MQIQYAIIVAMTPDGVIGQSGQMPWHLPADLEYFKRITWGAPIIMGRRTHQSIGRALPGRLNIVITRQADYAAPACIVCDNLVAACRIAGQYTWLPNDNRQCFIIGGGQLYQQSLTLVNRLYVTYLHASFTGDTYFPKINLEDWHQIQHTRFEPDAKNKVPYSFLVFERCSALAPC